MSNKDVGGRLIEMAETEYMVRGLGYIKSMDDLNSIPVGVDADGTPIRLRDVANVQIGPELRRGVVDLNGEGEVAGGVGLLVRKWSALAALGLFAVMLGAIGYHLAFDPMAMALPAVVLALLALMAFISRKGDSLLSAIH